MTSKESGKRILGLTTGGKKGSAFFWQRMLRKMYGCKAAEKKETGKRLSKIGVPMIFIKGSYFGTPLYTMC